jgi:DNA-binding transcriptional LysR family regulator
LVILDSQSAHIAGEIHSAQTSSILMVRLAADDHCAAMLRMIGGADLDGTAGPRFEHTYFLLEAAASGLGVAIGSYPLVQHDLASSRLVAPFGFLQRVNDPLTKMVISATQLTLFFTIFFAIFLDSTGEIFLRFRRTFPLETGSQLKIEVAKIAKLTGSQLGPPTPPLGRAR